MKDLFVMPTKADTASPAAWRNFRATYRTADELRRELASQRDTLQARATVDVEYERELQRECDEVDAICNDVDRLLAWEAGRRAPTARAEAKPQRPRLGWTVDRGSRHYATAVHEAGHALAVLLSKDCEIESAGISVDGSGLVRFKHHCPDSLTNQFVSLAGWASTRMFGLSDVNPAQDIVDAGLSYRSQPMYVDQVRDEASKDLYPHRQFIECLAERLYLCCPEAVSGATIKEGWRRYKSGVRCKSKELFA
jgi:hypothetical protein